MGFLKAVFWGLLSLSLLVFVHEAGHFFAARIYHFRVTEFFLGLPCRYNLSKRSKKNGTVYGITPILLGGYNRISGMNTNLNDSLPSVLEYIMRHGHVEVKSMIEDMGLNEDQVLSDISILEDWASIEAVYPDGKVNKKEYAPVYRTVARDANFLTIYDKDNNASVDPAYPAGSIQIPSEPFMTFFESEKKHTYVGGNCWQRISTVLAGPFINILLALVMITGVFYARGLAVPVNEPTVGSVIEGSLAQEAGIQKGDTITSVNGIEVQSFEEVSALINNAKTDGENLDLTLERDGKTSEVEISKNKIEKAQTVGVAPVVTIVPITFAQAWIGAWGFFTTSLGYVIQILNPMQFFEILNQSSSIVGISSMASSAAQNGLFTYILFLAMISMSLGLMNLLPIPPLDGGRILLEIIEAIRKKPASERVQNIIAMVGIAYLFFIFVYTMGHDIIRLAF